MGGYLDPHYDFNFYGGVRKNFITDDQFFGVMAGYYSSNFELTIDAESSLESPTINNTIQKNDLHPLIINLTSSYIQNRNIFYTLALQSAHDENVEIFAILFKLTHRFGSRYTPPLRDGAPTRGTL